MGGDSGVVDLRAEGDVVAESVGGGEADGHLHRIHVRFPFGAASVS